MPRKLPVWVVSALADVSTWPAALRVATDALETPLVLDDTSRVAAEACWMLLAISAVARDCSSTAAAMAAAISLISLMRPAIPPTLHLVEVQKQQ